MSELFVIKESLSPKMRWLREHEVRTYFTPNFASVEEPWIAWEKKDESEEGLPRSLCLCGHGETEMEAIVELAKKKGMRLWNEGGAA